jgi:DNA-binding transcriptional LysR family regulator
MAARALHMTQSAVSKRIRSLEEELGVDLFVRTPRGLAVTDAARIYHAHVSPFLAGLVEGAAKMATFREPSLTLRLQVLPILGDRWLVPRFPRFRALRPDIDVQFTTFVSDNESQAADGTFRFGDGNWPGQAAHLLFGRDVALVAAPELLDKEGGIGTAEDVLRYTFLEHFQTPLRWSEFAEANALRHATPRHIVRYGFYALVLRAAITGLGLALVPRALVADELRRGELVNPVGLGCQSRQAYHFTVPAAGCPSPSLLAFREWLLDEARRTET